jgi:hypothetical protein
MDEISNTANNALAEQSDTVPVPASDKTLYITESMPDFEYKHLLGQFVQVVDMKGILAKIEAGTQYVVQIPAEFQQAYNSGEYFIMQNAKTGKMWPSLMKVAQNGRTQVVTPLPIAEQAIVQGNSIQDLSMSYYNMLMQKQMAQLTAIVEKTFIAVKRIEHGQMDDRIGLLEAGKNGIMLALSMPEGQERTMQIDSSRQNILVAQAQIGKTLERRAAEFEALPKTVAGRFLREIVHSGYLESKDCEVAEMQEYYDLYLQSTKLLAASYAICGNMKTAEETFRLGEQFMKSVDFKKVQSIGRIHDNLSDMFCYHSAEYITAEKTICLEAAKAYDYVTIEVSGQKLLEVLNNGRAEEIQEESVE